MAPGTLPEDGEALVGSVPLPAGRRHSAGESGQLVAWVTEQPVPDAGRAWFALSDAHAVTGLVPVLLTQPEQPRPPAAGEPSEFGFTAPADVRVMDEMSAKRVLAAGWDADDDEAEPAARAPFGRRFPGLAPAGESPLSMAELQAAVASLQPAHVGLIAVSRPADVPATVGWSAFGTDQPGRGARSLEVGTVLRSWETRFSARLIRMDSDASIRLLAERPPRALESAKRVAAEHYAFADECNGTAGISVSDLAAQLVDAPIWTFRWH